MEAYLFNETIFAIGPTINNAIRENFSAIILTLGEHNAFKYFNT